MEKLKIENIGNHNKMVLLNDETIGKLELVGHQYIYISKSDKTDELDNKPFKSVHDFRVYMEIFIHNIKKDKPKSFIKKIMDKIFYEFSLL